MSKRIPLWFFTNFFVLFLVIALVGGTFSRLAQPQRLETWLDKSGLYQKLPTALINQAQISQTGAQETTTNFTDPLVRQAASTALSPEFLKQSSSEVVDGTFAWLKGAATEPKFSIELQPVKEKFADSLATNLTNRYQALPVCGTAQLPASTDPFTIDCRPSMGVDINQVVAEEKAKILQDPNFLGKPTLSASTVWSYGQNGSEKMLQNSNLPKAYQALQLLPVIAAGILLVLAIGIVFLSADKRSGVRKIGWRLTIVGVLWLIAVDLGALGLTKIRELAETQGKQAAVTAFKDILSPGLNAIRNDTILIGGALGGAVLLLGLILLITTHKRRAKPSKDKGAKKDDQKPTKEAEAKPEATKPLPSVATAPAVSKKTAPTAPLLKPKQQQKPAVITPTKSIGGNNNLIQ